MSDRYSGMTVNERLYVSGKIDEFDDAIEKKDVEKLKVILKEIEIDDASITSILEKYDFK